MTFEAALGACVSFCRVVPLSACICACPCYAGGSRQLINRPIYFRPICFTLINRTICDMYGCPFWVLFWEFIGDQFIVGP